MISVTNSLIITLKNIAVFSEKSKYVATMFSLILYNLKSAYLL